MSRSEKLTLMRKQATLTFKLRLGCFSLKSPLYAVGKCYKNISRRSPFVLPLLGHHKAAEMDWQIQPSEVVDHLVAQGSVMLHLKKRTEFKDGVQVSWSVLSCFVQTVYYRATFTELF